MKLANKSQVTQQHRQLLWIPILHYFFSITIPQKYYTEICLQEKKKYPFFPTLHYQNATQPINYVSPWCSDCWQSIFPLITFKLSFTASYMASYTIYLRITDWLAISVCCFLFMPASPECVSVTCTPILMFLCVFSLIIGSIIRVFFLFMVINVHK